MTKALCIETGIRVNRTLPNGVTLTPMDGGLPPMNALEKAGWIVPGHPGRGEASLGRPVARSGALGRLVLLRSNDTTA